MTDPTPTTGTTTAGDIRVMLVDDQPMIRMGLGMILSSEPGMSVVAEAANGRAAVAEAARVRPDVVLMDIRMPELDGIGATRAITDAGTAGAVVIVTTFDDEEYLLDSVRAGAFGFLLKDAGPDLLTAGIRTAFAGDTLIDPSMTRSLLEQRLADRLQGQTDRTDGPTVATVALDADGRAVDTAQRALLDTLSAREREVLAAVARGSSNAAIAAELWVSEATVKTHISSVLTKTRTTSRVQAAVFAYESGFVRPGWLTQTGA
ncbi:response regulator [Curtobacterium sp. RRHDQ10]|uniref:response regulator n=1 Tax=Curtobacterium phyllosphaerae TaxID=3413379 RepID=UPI003BF0DC81